jgi:CheY-like chemotaxis protein
MGRRRRADSVIFKERRRRVSERPCVLIVEADIVVRHPLAEYLRDCGYWVLEARGAAEAQTLLQSMSSSIDVILADASGPAPGGFQLATWVRGFCPDVSIVLAGGVAKAVEICQDGPAALQTL